MLKKAISSQRWTLAQVGEKKYHQQKTLDELLDERKAVYQIYFKYLGINNNLNNKSVIEIGPGRVPALLNCENYKHSYVVEPIKFDDIEDYCKNKNFDFIHHAVEDIELPKVDEIWMMNLMQHVKNPDLLIEKAKKSAKFIRYFEGIDSPTDTEHPFSFSEADYRYYFNDSVKIYTSIGEKNFHTARCVYGIFTTDSI